MSDVEAEAAVAAAAAAAVEGGVADALAAARFRFPVAQLPAGPLRRMRHSFLCCQRTVDAVRTVYNRNAHLTRPLGELLDFYERGSQQHDL